MIYNTIALEICYGQQTKPICVVFQEDARLDVIDSLVNDVLNQQLQLNVEYRTGTVDYVSLQHTDTKDDVTEGLVSAGLVTVEARKEKRLKKLVANLIEKQNAAKGSRVGRWRRGLYL